tara:strand:+ start:1083 stop:1214 length:132 start_codon:yes stop_codon:yes gene_type:complete
MTHDAIAQSEAHIERRWTRVDTISSIYLAATVIVLAALILTPR